MLTLICTNKDLEPIAHYLSTRKLPPRLSRVRSALLRELTRQLECVAASEMELARTYAVREQDEDAIKVDETGAISFADAASAQAFVRERETLMCERSELMLDGCLDMGGLVRALLDEESLLVGEEAEGLDALMLACEEVGLDGASTQ